LIARAVQNETAARGVLPYRPSWGFVPCSISAPLGRRPSLVRFAVARSNGGLTAGSPYSNALVAVSSRISLVHRHHLRKPPHPPVVPPNITESRRTAMDPSAQTEAVLIVNNGQLRRCHPTERVERANRRPELAARPRSASLRWCLAKVSAAWTARNRQPSASGLRRHDRL
jgi:hypothetical protein